MIVLAALLTVPWLPVSLLPSTSAVTSARSLTLLQQEKNELMLVQVGAPGVGTEQYALGPKGYAAYKDDPIFIVGQSTAKDVPYVLPGPADQWAGGRTHSDTIVFALKSVPASGRFSFYAMFHDAQSSIPPRLTLYVNGRKVKSWQTPAGGGDDSLSGSMAHAHPFEIDAPIPANDLKVGNNIVELRNDHGSWAVLRAMGIKSPFAAGLATVTPSLTLTSLPQPQAVLKTSDGPRQELDFRAMRIGPAMTGVWSIDAYGHHLTSPAKIGVGSSIVSVLIPKATKMEKVSLEFKATSGETSQFTMQVKPVRSWTVYLMPHAHLDVGYTNTQAEVSEIQRHNLLNALEVHRTEPAGISCKYSFEGTWILDQLLDHGSKDDIRQVAQGLKDGTLCCSAAYANELTGLMRPEEMMASYRLGQQIGKVFGVRPDVATQTDVPGVTWGDVTALKAAGIRALILMPNPGDRLGDVIRDWQDKPFWWVGPDGKTKILLWETVSYGMAHGLHRFNGDRKDIFHDPEPDQHFVGPYLLPRIQQLAGENYPYSIIAIPWSVTDNSPVDGDVPKQVADWNAKYESPKIEIKSFSGAVDGLLKAYGKSLPSHSGDLSPYWEDGAGSSALETAMNRRSADRLVQAEALDAMRSSPNPAWTKLLPRFHKAWSDVVLYSEHTWGSYDSVSNPNGAFTKAVWAGKKAYADDAAKESKALLGAALNSPMALESFTCDVWNTESWARSGIVRLSAASAQGCRAAVDDRTGKPLLCQPTQDGGLDVWVNDVPAFGRVLIHLTHSAPAVKTQLRATQLGASGHVLENKFVRVELDPKTGAIARLVDKASGRNLVDASKAELNQYFYLIGGDPEKAQSNTDITFKTVTSGPLEAEIDVHSSAPGTNGLVQKYMLTANSDRVHIDNLLDKTAVLDKESVHIAFPLNVPQGQMRIDGPWSVIRPEIDQLPGANRNWLCTQRFVDVSNKQFGVTVTCIDAPLVEVGGITATVMGGGGRSSDWIHHLPQTQTFYSWALNNIWYTNYRADQSGALLFRYQIAPHGAVSPAAWAKAGIDASEPLFTDLGRNASYSRRLAIDGNGVIATLFKRTDDGKGWIVRLWGASGKSTDAKVRWLAGPSKMWVSDVAEEKLTPIKDSGVTVPGWGEVTVRIESVSK